MPKVDIHDFGRRLDLIEAALARKKLPRGDRRLVRQFRDQCFADGLGTARVTKYMQTLKRMYDLAPAGQWRARKSALISLLARIERSNWQAWTKHDYKLALRKYLAFAGRQDLAALVRLPKVHTWKLPEELVSWDDILALMAATGSEHYIAFLYVLWESGARIGELLSLQRKHVTFDSQGAILIVDGKTGMRRVRIIESAPALDVWISCRSFRPDDRIFPNTYRGYTKRLRTLAIRAGIEKRIYPHLFRHSRATFLAGYLTEAQLCAYMGWTIGSAMPRIYVHLAGHDLDAALARIPALPAIAQGQYAMRAAAVRK